MKKVSPELREKIIKVKLLALDSDGVLTDGGVYIADDGKEFRRFNIKDGAGLKRLARNGIIIAIISSSPCRSIVYRAAQLGIDEVYIGVENKLEKLKEICRRVSVSLDEVCFMGDDLADMEAMQAVGISCAPQDAAKEIRKCCGIVSSRAGGCGAVREVADIICKYKGSK